MQGDYETNVTEIELTPDGRIFVFGASREVISLLHDLGLSDEALRLRLGHVDQLAPHNVSAGGDCTDEGQNLTSGAT